MQQRTTHRQRGLSLLAVAIIMGGLAALAMLLLFSMRAERNILAEKWRAVTGQPQPAAAQGAATTTAAPPPITTVVKKCIINGKTVYSDTECKNQANAKSVTLHDNVMPAIKKPPPPEDAGSASMTLQEKATQRAIDQATR